MEQAEQEQNGEFLVYLAQPEGETYDTKETDRPPSRYYIAQCIYGTAVFLLKLWDDLRLRDRITTSI